MPTKIDMKYLFNLVKTYKYGLNLLIEGKAKFVELADREENKFQNHSDKVTLAVRKLAFLMPMLTGLAGCWTWWTRMMSCAASR